MPNPDSSNIDRVLGGHQQGGPRASTVYQIARWDDHFENNKSRERDSCSFVCVPNKQHGVGLTLMLSEPDGRAMYGLWSLLIGFCSRQRRPRDGWLTEDGKPGGKPLTPAQLGMLYRAPTPEVERALVFLVENVGWIVAHNADARRVPAECPPSARPMP